MPLVCLPLRRCVIALVLTLAMLLVILPPAVANAATQIFPVEPSVPLPLSTELLPATSGLSILSGDFNGDGLADAVVLEGNNVTASAVLVLLNTKGGTPTQVTTTLANCNNPSMAEADLNQDHKLDLVLSCGANYIQAFLGNGDGSFQAAIASQTSSYPSLFTLADFNKDGLPDLAYATETGFAIALSTGGGHFGSSQLDSLAGSPYNAIASGDFNGDGKQDLVFAGGSGSGAYLLGNGDGTFESPATISGTLAQITVADFNNDGYSDLAYFTPAYNGQTFNPAVVVLAGGSSGLADTGIAIPATGASPSFFTAVKLAPGGNLDLVLGNNNGAQSLALPASAFIFLGDGKGGFNHPVAYAANSVYGVADLNGDGIPDLAGIEYPFDNALPYAPGNGDGTFQALPNTPNGQFSQGLTVADINADGLADTILFDLTGRPEVLLGRGDGRFTVVPNGSLPIVAPALFATADFNGDGKIDVAAILPGTFAINGTVKKNGSIAMFPGNGDGTLSPLPQASLNVAGVTAVATGDFNGDKKQDLALLITGNGGLSGAYALFLPGNGDGTFGAAVQISLAQTIGAGTFQAVDLNGDGITDLIALGASYLGSADGSFTLLQVLPVDGWAEDLNGDGNLELVNFGGAGNADELNIYSGNTDGTFSVTPQSSNAGPATFYTSAVGDLNGDGLADIAVWSTYGVNVYFNQGDGTFVQDSTQYFSGTSNQGYSSEFFGYSGSSVAIALARANSSSAPSGAQRNLDALLYTSGGITSLLNTGNSEPRPVPDLSVSFAGGVTTITTGSSIIVSATLFVNATAAPTGTVSFFAGNTQIGISTVTNGVASATATIAGSGSVVIRAVYSGDTNYASATGFASLTINAPVATTTTLSATATTVNEQQQLTLTAAVQGNAPTGTVTFLNGTNTLGTAQLSNGSAGLTTSFANAGTVSVTANYPGDPNNLGSVSVPVKIAVVAPAFSVAASPSSAAVAPGQSATFTLTVTPAGGFSKAVGFSCGALPSLATCAFSPQSVTPANGQPAQVKLTISTAAASANLRGPMPASPYRAPWLPGGAIVSVASLLGFLRTRAYRRYYSWLGVPRMGVLLCGLALCLIGCGGAGNSTPSNPGTPAGTSTITITASAPGSASTQSASVQLIVH